VCCTGKDPVYILLLSWLRYCETAITQCSTLGCAIVLIFAVRSILGCAVVINFEVRFYTGMYNCNYFCSTSILGFTIVNILQYCSILGCAIVPICYLITWTMTHSVNASCMAASLVIFGRSFIFFFTLIISIPMRYWRREI